MKNKELKQRLVKNGVYDDFRAFKRHLYKNEIDIFKLSNDEIQTIYENYKGYKINNIELESLIQMTNALKVQYKRINERVYFMNKDYGNLYFITLTFNDEAMKLSENTRHQKVCRLLQDNCYDYIANIDYGKENGREHYHAIVQAQSDNFLTLWGYGYTSSEPVKDTQDDTNRVAKYVAKLTNHALKVKQTKLIYKRDCKYLKCKKILDKKYKVSCICSKEFVDFIQYYKPTKNEHIQKLYELYYRDYTLI